METNRIRQFCVVAELENLRKAAEILNMTHGALSKSMQVLSAELGITLFYKVGRGISLTDEGKVFYKKSTIFLESVNMLLAKDDIKNKSLSIGSFEVFTTHFFAQMVATEFTDTKFCLKEYMPGELEKAILDNQVDFGITYELIPTKGVDAFHIATCEMGLFGKASLMNKYDIHSVPFVAPIIPIKSMISGVKGLDGWPDDKISRNRFFEVDMLETALQLSSRGKAVGLYPKFLINIYNSMLLPKYQLEELSLPSKAKGIKRKIYLLIKQGKEESSEVKKISRIIRAAVS